MLTKTHLFHVAVEETLDLLRAKQELVLDQRLHVDIAVDDGFKELGEVCALTTTSILVESTMRGKGTAIFRIDWNIVVTRGQVVLCGEEMFNFGKHVDNLLRCIDLVCIMACTWVDLQVFPDDRLLVEESCEDLLHQLVLHVHHLPNDEYLVTIVARISIGKRSNLAFYFIF